MAQLFPYYVGNVSTELSGSRAVLSGGVRPPARAKWGQKVTYRDATVELEKEAVLLQPGGSEEPTDHGGCGRDPSTAAGTVVHAQVMGTEFSAGIILLSPLPAHLHCLAHCPAIRPWAF